MSCIDYPLAQIRAIVFDVDGVLSPSTVPMTATGEPQRMVNIKDGYALQHAVRSGLRIAIITGGKSDAILARYQALGVSDIFMGAAHKLPVLQEWMNVNNLRPKEVAFMGDDIPDIPCLKYVGLPCSPSDAAPEVRMLARFVAKANGGYGCARAIIEQVLRAQGRWANDTHAFGW